MSAADEREARRSPVGAADVVALARVRELEAPELAGYADMWAAAPPAVAADLGLADAALPGGAHAVASSAHPGSRLLNHTLGLPSAATLDTAALDALRRFFHDRGVPALACVVDGAPAAAQLAAAGWEEGYAWVKFARDAAAPIAPPRVACPLAVRPVAAADAPRFGELVAGAFELGPAFAAWFAALASGRSGWTCLGAHGGDRLVATVALFAAPGADSGWLTWAATDPAARGRGAQPALMAAGIEHARELGLRAVVCETGDAGPDRRDVSFRNILAAGFETVFRRPFWRLDP